MKALIKKKPEVGIWMDDIETPYVGRNDVLVKIKKTAICGTDLHIYQWNDWAQKTIPIPLTIGHEFVGEIVEQGSEVNGYKVGQRVSGEGHITCGICRNCRAGRQHLCRGTIGIGVNRPGAFAEFLSIPASNLYSIPDDISDDLAAILDPFGNAMHTALSFPMAGEDVLITGAGPIGIMAVAIARHIGAKHIVITDINDYRLDLAKKMGATRAINISRTTLKDVMNELKMTEGFDIALEMSGHPDAMKTLIDHTSHGARIALLGLLPNNTAIDWDQIIFKGLIMKGIYGREMFETWYKMICMLQMGLDIAPVITHHFAFDDYQVAFETLMSGQAGKVILEW